MKKRYLTCLLLALLLLGACQPQEEAANAGSFTVTFTDHSGAAATALEVYLFDADALSPSLTRPRSGYLACTSIHAPGPGQRGHRPHDPGGDLSLRPLLRRHRPRPGRGGRPGEGRALLRSGRGQEVPVLRPAGPAVGRHRPVPAGP